MGSSYIAYGFACLVHRLTLHVVSVVKRYGRGFVSLYDYLVVSLWVHVPIFKLSVSCVLELLFMITRVLRAAGFRIVRLSCNRLRLALRGSGIEAVKEVLDIGVHLVPGIGITASSGVKALINMDNGLAVSNLRE